MDKRLKLRIYKLITTTLQSCRSKHPSTLPQDPVPSFSRSKPSSTVHLPNPNPNRSSLKHHSSPPHFTWQEDDNWHVVAKIYEPQRKLHNSSDDEVPTSRKKTQKNARKAQKKKRRNVPSRIRTSTSSADSEWFSEEETETLVSSSIDSSSSHMPVIQESQTLPTMFHHRKSSSIRRRNNRQRRRNNRQRRSGSGNVVLEKDEDVPARLSVFKRMIPCTVDGKVKESFAIVKKSNDPYGDFRDSMMDMVVEKQMFEAADLEQLLQCFLSLNSRSYHGVIVEAFSEIWEAIFCQGRDQGSRM